MGKMKYLNNTKCYWGPTPGEAIPRNIEHLRRLKDEVFKTTPKKPIFFRRGWYQRNHKKDGYEHTLFESYQHFRQEYRHRCQQSIKIFFEPRTIRRKHKTQRELGCYKNVQQGFQKRNSRSLENWSHWGMRGYTQRIILTFYQKII